MAESNKMKKMPVNKLMVQMGIPMILSMALQAVYNIVDSAFVGNMRSGSEAALVHDRSSFFKWKVNSQQTIGEILSEIMVCRVYITAILLCLQF